MFVFLLFLFMFCDEFGHIFFFYFLLAFDLLLEGVVFKCKLFIGDFFLLFEGLILFVQRGYLLELFLDDFALLLERYLELFLRLLELVD